MPAAPLRSDLAFIVGDTWSGPAWAVIIDGVFVDLANGWSVTAHARVTTDDPAVLMEWSTANGRVLLGSAQVTTATGVVTVSTVRLTHPAAVTAAMVPVSARYDCEITKTGVTHTITEGRVTARMGVTR